MNDPAPRGLITAPPVSLPVSIVQAGDQAARRYAEFFTASIRNPHTRRAYMRACSRFFFWCEQRALDPVSIRPLHVAAWVEQLQQTMAASGVRQQLAAVRMLCDWLVTGQVMPVNPAASVQGPRHVTRTGRTPVLKAGEWRRLMAAIPQETVRDLRDCALIAVLSYSFARISAALALRVGDFRLQGTGRVLWLHEKGGRHHVVSCHHALADAVHAYVQAAGIGEDREGWLFRSARGHSTTLSIRPMSQTDAWRMLRRRSAAAGITTPVGCHTFRATGITAYLSNGGTLAHAQAMAAHESPRTTRLYDRSQDPLIREEVERIRF